MSKNDIISLFEKLITKKAVLLSPYGTHWTPQICYADGSACVIFSNTSSDDETLEFLHYIGVDKLEVKDNKVFMNGSDGWGGDDALDGQFYIPYSI
jgi:hypothetical protein